MVARLCEHNDRTCLPDPWMSVMLMKKKEHAAVCSMGVLNLLSHQESPKLNCSTLVPFAGLAVLVPSSQAW